MGYNIGPKIGIDGEAEFRSEIRKINDTYKALEAETRAVTKAFEASGNEQGTLEATSKQLSKQIDNQKEKFKLLEDALAKAEAKYKPTSIEATRLRGALYDTQATITSLESELRSTNQQLSEYNATMSESEIEAKQLADAEISLKNQIAEVEAEYKAIVAETKSLAASYENTENQTDSLRATSQQLEKQIDSQKKKIELLQAAIDTATKTYGENSVEANKLRTSLYDTKTAISGLESELSDTNRKLESLGDGLNEAGNEAEDASDSFIDFSDILNANLAANLAQEGLEELIDLLGEFAEGSLEAAAEVNAASSQFSQTFGDMEDSARESLESISENTDIAVTRMQGSFTQLYAFTKTAGADSETALDIASRAMSAAADSAAYYDKSIEEVTESLQSFLKGNYENDAALGISATETTRNTKANEMYAVSFDKLSESQKVDVLLAMVEAGNQASGALGQAARESDSWANVTGELDEAMKQLQATVGQPALKLIIPAIQDITDSVYELIEESDWEKLDSGISDFVSSMEDADKQFESTSKKTESAAYSAEWYVKRLEKLEDAGLDTADAQNEYAAVVKELNGLIPDLNLTIDEQTGLIEQNTSVILADIQAWKDRAVAQAMQDKVTAQLQAQGQAEAELYTAKAALITLEAEEAELKRQLAEATGGATQETSLLTQALQTSAEAFLYSSDGAAGLSAANASLTGSLTESRDKVAQLEKQLEENQIEQAGLNKSIKSGEATLSSYDAELLEAEKAMELYNEETAAASEAQSDFDAKVQEVQQSIETLEAEYADAVAAARTSIDSQIGLFDELSTESKMTTQEVIANWQNQQTAFENYAANLEKAVDMGLDQALIQQLSDGSEESMLILDEFVNDTETSVEEINAAFRGLDGAKDDAASAMAEVRTGANAEMDKLIADSNTWGYDIVTGAANGVRRNAYIFANAMEAMVVAGQNRVHAVADMHSPSRVAMEDGENIVLGTVIGVDENIKRFEASMEDLAKSGQMAFLNERLALAADYPNYVELPTYDAPRSNSTSVSYGNLAINIYQQPGEDEESLAYRIKDILQTDVMKGEAALIAYQ